MRAALCFLISYEQLIYKETLWREWIEPNRDILEVFIHYTDAGRLSEASEWIQAHAIPSSAISKTSYYHVVPAYMAVATYACRVHSDVQWLIYLTDSCCPLVSPATFRRLFFAHWRRSIIKCREPWWDISANKRANLSALPRYLQWANDAWFLLCRQDFGAICRAIKRHPNIVSVVSAGGLANESLFAVLLQLAGRRTAVICATTHVADWGRPSSSTSPHVFVEGDARDVAYLRGAARHEPVAMFFRKVAADFPDTTVRTLWQFRDTLTDTLPPPVYSEYHQHVLCWIWMWADWFQQWPKYVRWLVITGLFVGVGMSIRVIANVFLL